jgi:hypothetical protein
MPRAFGVVGWIDEDRESILRNHMTACPKSLSTLIDALTLFGLAGFIVVATIPRFVPIPNSLPSRSFWWPG